jgi:hypothetical protein
LLKMDRERRRRRRRKGGVRKGNIDEDAKPVIALEVKHKRHKTPPCRWESSTKQSEARGHCSPALTPHIYT